MFESIREIKRMQEHLRQAQALGAFDSSLFKQAQEGASLARAFDSSLFKQAREIATLYNAFDSRVLRQTQEIATVIRASAVVWDTSVGTALQECYTVNLFSSHPFLAEQLMEPYEYWGSFFQTTVGLLDQANTEQVAKALQGSLIIAQEQLFSSTAQLEAIIEKPEDGDEAGPTVPLNALEIQQAELLADGTIPTSADHDALVALSPTARLVQQTRHILDLVTRSNRERKLQGKDEIFKPTTRLLMSFNHLPWIAVHDEESLGNFVDCLYFILYEAAGKDNLRFLTEDYLKDEDCTIIWAIKHLRNKYLRHDPDHGKPGDIKKSWQDLSSKLALFGLPHLPVSVSDYQYLQQRLLQEVEQFLKRLLSNMVGQ